MATVLHVTECFAGGVSRAIYTAVQLAPEHNHLLLWAGDETPREGVFNSVVDLPSGALARILAIRSAVVNRRPDVVHAHSSWAGVYSRVLPVGAPLVYQPHCYKFDDPDSSKALRWAYRLAERLLAPRADTVVVLSPHEDALAKGLHPSGRRQFLPNVPTLRPDAPRAAVTPDRVFMIGRLTRQKDPNYFLRVGSIVAQAWPTAQLTWVGDGDAAARAMLENSGVEVTGWLDAPQLRTLLSEGGVYLHSASYEGFPLSVLDAAAFEIPVVARQIDALAGSPVYQAASEQQAADRVVALLRGDEEPMAEAARANSALLQTMSEEKQASALADLYRVTAGVST